MFDTITGLPVHPLSVHAVVVLLPLACLATVAVAVRPAWRRFATPLAALNLAVAVAAFVAKQSGEALAHRVKQFNEPAGLGTHAEWGDRLFALSLALFVGALVIRWTRDRPALARVVVVVAVIGALATVGVTAYVGHTGATMVWKDVVANTHG